MEKTIGSFVNEMLIAAGLPEDNESLKKLLTFPELSKPAPEFLTIDAAKNNATLKSYFTASALDPLDKELKNSLTDLGFEIPDFENEKSTYKKYELLRNKFKEQLKEAKKNPHSTDEEKKQLADTVRGLNAELAQLKGNTVPKSDYEKALQDFEKEREVSANESIISSYKFGNGFDDEINRIALRQYVDQAMSEKGAIRRLSDDKRSIRLMQAKSPDLEYFEDNKAVPYKSFVDKIVADKKMQSVRRETPPQQPQDRNLRNNTPPVTQATTNFREKADRALEMFKQGSETAV
jgi:hypothetical protein